MDSFPTMAALAVRPPRRGLVLVIAVDPAPTAYDITGLQLGGGTPSASGREAEEVHLMLQADGNDVYFLFDRVTGTQISPGAQVAVGAAVTVTDGMCGKIPAGTNLRVAVYRNVDKFLQVRCDGGTGQLRIWAASDAGA